MSNINIIVAAQVQDAVTGLNKVTQSTQRMQNQVDKASSTLKRHSNQYNSTAVATNKWAKGALQQAGYQVGDFAVQVAGGTNAMQAFGQQGSQLAGVFGPIGAVVGAGIAIVSAIAVAFQKSSQAAKEASGSIVDLTEAMASYNAETKKAQSNLKLMISGFESMAALALQQQIDQQRVAVQAAEDSLARTRGNALVGARQNLATEKEKLDALLQQQRTMLAQVDMAANITKFANARTQAAAKMNEQLRAEQIVMSQTMGVHQSVLDLIEMNAQKQAEINSVLESQNRFANARTVAAAKMNEQLRAEDIVMSQIVGKSALVLQLEEKRLRVKKLIKGLEPKKVYSGRGGDPRKVSDDYMNELGYTPIEELITMMSDKVPAAVKSVGSVIKQELAPEMQRLVNFADSVGQSFENAMMSAVQGTESVKDAFRGMASNIISELYRVFVVKRITGFISDAVSMAALPTGRANTGTMGLPSFAGGGYTGSASRSGGLDGKGGFMAMLHPRETVVDHTKGDTDGGQVVVNQTINISTGVQQTVRSEIKTLMPQIADAAKSAVADAKRRGGSYGRAMA